MSKEEKLRELDKVIKYFKEKLETTDDVATVNAKIVKWTMVREKIENDEL